MHHHQLRRYFKKAAAILCIAALAVTAVPASAASAASASAAQAATAVSDYQMYLERNVGVDGDSVRAIALGQNTTGYINHASGNMALKIDILDGLSLVYNAQTDADNRMGLGVTCNYLQTVERVDIDTFVQTEWDGSRHYFKRLRGEMFRDDRNYMLTNSFDSSSSELGCIISRETDQGSRNLFFDRNGYLIQEELGENITTITYDYSYQNEYHVIDTIESSKFGKVKFGYARPIRGQLRLAGIELVQEDGTSRPICAINITDTSLFTSGTLNSVKFADGNEVSLQYDYNTHLLSSVQDPSYPSSSLFFYGETNGLTRIGSFQCKDTRYPNRPPYDGATFYYEANSTVVYNVDGSSYTVDVWSGQ